MNTSNDPLTDPEVVLRIYQSRRKLAAILSLIVGVSSLFAFVFPLCNRMSFSERVNSLSTIVGTIGIGLAGAFLTLGIKFLLRENPLVKMVLNLSERIRKLEAKN